MTENELWLSRAIEASDDQLFEDLARFSLGTKLAEDLRTSGDVEPDIAVGFQAMDDLRELGGRIFNRIASELYGVVCGSDQNDSAERKKILEASGLSEAAALALIAGLIGQMFGLGGAVCAAAAALILRRIIKPSGDEMCKFWKEKYL